MTKSRIKYYFIVIVVFSFFVLSTTRTYADAEIIDSNKNTNSTTSITVVLDDNYPPFSFRDSKGDLQGIAIDQWKLFQAKTGIKPIITGMEWNKAYSSMINEEFDVIDTISYNIEREKIFDYTKPYATIDVPIFWQKNITGITTVASLKGFPVGAKKGDNSINILKKNGITNIIEYDSAEAVIKAAMEQKLVIFVLGKPPGLYYLYKMQIQDNFNYSSSLYTSEFHRAVKEGDTKLLNTINEGFSKISKVEYESIDEKWFGKTESQFYKSKIFKFGLLGVIIIMIFALLLIIWNRSLQRKVKEKTKELYYLGYRDQLTGLFNRRFFEEELTRLDILENLPLTIVMADVNGLKLVNDSFGHAAGDDLLKKVAQVISSGCRSEDIVARLGGDEFVLVLCKTDMNKTDQIIKNINMLAEKEKVGSVDISVSFGYETKNDISEKIQEIFKKAEDHMYKRKIFEGPSMRGKTIKTIIKTLHEKNKREEQHSHRVAILCECMGKAIGFSEIGVNELKNVGLLHDIGKIAIDESVLNKPGKLDKSEWDEMQRHPEIGYRILSTVNEMSEMAEYVLAHHERWDGSGYPKGLKGEEIPLQSRIISIADAYDAMTSERSYHNSLSQESAIAELQKNAGSQFDAELVSVFVEKVLIQYNFI